MSNYGGKCRLNVEIEFDPTMTSPEALAAYFDRVLRTAGALPGPLSYARVGEFAVFSVDAAAVRAAHAQSKLGEPLTLRGVTLPRRVWESFDSRSRALVIGQLMREHAVGPLEGGLLVDAWRRGERPSGWEPIPD